MYNFVEILSNIPKVGHNFEISAISTVEAENVEILLSTGSEKSSEAVLSIELNFASNKIVVNKNLEKEIALNRGEKFNFVIRIESGRFQLSYNGDSLNELNFETSPDKIRSIIIHGDVSKLIKVNHLDAQYPTIEANDEFLAFESYIPVKYQPGHVIAISGQCNEEFYLMFTKNGCNRQLIHFNVRFDEGVVVMNTEDDVDCWTEDEARSDVFPFELEKPFKIVFAFAEDVLKIAVNGSSLMEFIYDRIYFDEGETLWDILSGFRIMNRDEEAVTSIKEVKHFQMESSCNGFEQYSAL